MKLRTSILRRLSILGLLVILWGCKETPTKFKPDANPTLQEQSFGEATLGNKTVQLPPETIQERLTFISSDGTIYSFNSDDPALNALESGSIMMLGVSSVTPEGALRKVISKQVQTDGSIRIITERATLEEAFENLEIKLENLSLNQSNVEKIVMKIQGTDFEKIIDPRNDITTTSVGLSLPINDEISVNVGGSLRRISLSGRLNTSPSIEVLSVSISDANLNEFSLIVRNEIEATLEVSVDAAINFGVQRVIFTHEFGPTIVGPLVIRPTIDVVVELSGNIDIDQSLEFSTSSTSRAGFIYEDGDLERISSFELVPRLPSFDSSNQFEFQLGLGPEVKIKLYGAVGASLIVSPYGNFSYQGSRSPSLQSFIGVSGKAKLYLEIFKKTFVSVDIPTLFDWRRLVFHNGLVTNNVTGITNSSAVSGGSITSDGGAIITQRGVCWSDSGIPLFPVNCTSDGSGVGSYTSTISGLNPSTNYSLRSYAISSAGIANGKMVSFSTLADGGVAREFITSGPFAITTKTYATSSNWDHIVDTVVGVGYRVADWNDLFNYHQSGKSLAVILDSLELDFGSTGFVTRNGNKQYSSTRYYYISRHNGATPGHFLVHAQIGGNLIDLGSWSGSRPILAFNPNYGTSTSDRDNTTAVLDVTNPVTGRTWMDRNLGASRVATSSTDAEAYGDLYQWGRGADGHQKRNSPTSSILSSNDQPGHGSFILAPNSPNDWRSPQNNNLWQGVNGLNNPCPVGYRIPTQAEWEAERASWSVNTSAGAFASPLKLTIAGYRSLSSGLINDVDSRGHYWSTTINGTIARNKYFSSNDASIHSNNRANGFSMRCIKESSSVGSQTVTDIDGNVYPTVQIGTQVWMAANLKTTRYRDGSTIPNVTNATTWSGLTTGAWANYNNDSANDAIYGKLYNWYAVADARNVCPTGWHVPSDAEWTVLSNFLGTDVGFKMKSTSGWSSNGNGSNASGFNGLPGGYRGYDGTFYGVGRSGSFWSSTQASPGGAWYRSLSSANRDLARSNYNKKRGFSVRCLRD